MIDTLFAIAIGGTIGWAATTLFLAFRGEANTGTMAGVAMPVLLWTLFVAAKHYGA